MGLSAFNAMRAREKAKTMVDSKESEIVVQEVKAPETETMTDSKESEIKNHNFQKKTDAEKLKKKE